MSRFLLFFLFISVMYSCGPDPVPLPIGQIRIDFPRHSYHLAKQPCPYSLEIPDYSQIVEKPSNPGSCWTNVQFPNQRATLHLTYRRLHGDLARTLEETHKLTYDHHIKADNIVDERILIPSKEVYGTVYSVSGNVASNVQFYLTDSTTHFLRGALYFNASPNKDSLAPVVAHLKLDIDHLVESLNWID